MLRVAVGAVAALLAGCGSDERPAATAPAPPPTATAAPTPAPPVEWPVVNGQQAVLLNAQTPTDRVVLYVHGAAESGGSVVGDIAKRPSIAALRAAGFAVASSDARGDNWGSAASVEDYVALVDWLAARGLTRVVVLAQSMGGLDGLQLIDVRRPLAWAGIFPVCDLRAVYDAKPGYRESIRRAYAAATSGWAPTGLSPVSPDDVAGLPMIFWASPQDTQVEKATNTDVCAAEAETKGAQVTVVPTTGDHGDVSNFDPERLIAFFEAAAPAG
jgi:pimeloyl-ACP methyl ester carboxylesterase